MLRCSGSHNDHILHVLKREPEAAGERSCQDYQGLLPRVDIFSFRQSYYQTTSPTPRVLSSHTAVPEAKAWAVFEQAELSFKATESNPFSFFAVHLFSMRWKYFCMTLMGCLLLEMLRRLSAAHFYMSKALA